jgi:hypothetical protein
MNDRIHELAKECYVYTGSVHTNHFAYWKFAELIIAECIEAARTVGGDAGIEMETTIRNIFGVEE